LEKTKLKARGWIDNVVPIASCCTSLDDRLDVDENILSPDHQRRLELLMDGNDFVQTHRPWGFNPLSLVRAMEEAIITVIMNTASLFFFVILQNDGDCDDYCCTAHNRAIE
jgi:hypothetical protein